MSRLAHVFGGSDDVGCDAGVVDGCFVSASGSGAVLSHPDVAGASHPLPASVVVVVVVVVVVAAAHESSAFALLEAMVAHESPSCLNDVVVGGAVPQVAACACELPWLLDCRGAPREPCPPPRPPKITYASAQIQSQKENKTKHTSSRPVVVASV